MIELSFQARQEYVNAYAEISVFVDFTREEGEAIRRPAFWDGGQTWRVRFTSPQEEAGQEAGHWAWRSICSETSDTGLHDQQGAFVFASSTAEPGSLRAKGLLQMSPGRRNVVHADGSAVLLVGDTAWALPWRGTPETVRTYAADRRSKGFNCVLLMCVQPDQDARGPRDRHSAGGFDVGFEDLPSGHINQLNPAYFQELDTLISILLDHGIIPIYQPVFQGYGWKGLRALGASVDPQEYARFCCYLVARYGAQAALWLVSADGTGLAPCVAAGGEEIYQWDTSHQPLGIHYSPFDQEHRNGSHQDADWLDFQWCQTGHDGLDINKVSKMHDTLPTKGVANGEPTYEGIGSPSNAAGWWQGHTAWSNLTWGGTMGVFYGVAALWQWKLTSDEPGWPEWARDSYSWEEALAREGSTYVGAVSKALAAFDFVEMTRHPELAEGKPCVAKPGVFYCVYLPEGGEVTLSGLQIPLLFCWFNPKTGEMTEGGQTNAPEFSASAPDAQPWVLLAGSNSPDTGR